MYQVEVKLQLTKSAFVPSQGWEVHCHLDGMELGKGDQQHEGKAQVAKQCVQELEALGVHLRSHADFPRADVVAIRSSKRETHVVEVEGASKRQLEQAVYSALGQLIFKMNDAAQIGRVAYGLAVPDEPGWRTLLDRIPVRVRRALNLHVYFASADGISHSPPPDTGL